MRPSLRLLSGSTKHRPTSPRRRCNITILATHPNTVLATPQRKPNHTSIYHPTAPNNLQESKPYSSHSDRSTTHGDSRPHQAPSNHATTSSSLCTPDARSHPKRQEQHLRQDHRPYSLIHQHRRTNSPTQGPSLHSETQPHLTVLSTQLTTYGSTAHYLQITTAPKQRMDPSPN